MLPFMRFRFVGVFAVSLNISRFFVESDGIIGDHCAENSDMIKVENDMNHKESKNYDEPESYRKITDTERSRNAQ